MGRREDRGKKEKGRLGREGIRRVGSRGRRDSEEGMRVAEGRREIFVRYFSKCGRFSVNIRELFKVI